MESDEEGIQGKKRVASKVIQTGKAKDPKQTMNKWGQFLTDVRLAKKKAEDSDPGTPTPVSRRSGGTSVALRRRRGVAGKDGEASEAKP